MKSEEISSTTNNKSKANNEDRLYIGLTGLAIAGLVTLLFFALY